MTRPNLAAVEAALTLLAAECIALGTPYAVRRKIKDALTVLPVIEAARTNRKATP